MAAVIDPAELNRGQRPDNALPMVVVIYKK